MAKNFWQSSPRLRGSARERL